MKISVLKPACALVLILLPARLALTQPATSRIVSAANAFLATLDTAQRQRVLFSFDDEEQRRRWSNFPTTMVPRAGLSLKEMTPAQRTAAMALVAAALSPRGFEKVQQIMEGDEMLKSTEGNGPPGGRGRGGPPPGGAQFGKDLYFISLLGKPSEKDPWMLQFGGHHLALNITIAGDQGIPRRPSPAPSLLFSPRTARPYGRSVAKAIKP